MSTSSSTTVHILTQVGSAPIAAKSTCRAWPSYCCLILMMAWLTKGWQVTSNARQHGVDALIDIGGDREFEGQDLLGGAAENAVEDGVRPPGDAQHLENGVVADRHVIAHEL